MNRFITSLVQFFLWLPILFIIRELIKEKLN
jgi:hypothetical protein